MKEALSLGCGAGLTVDRAFSWDRTQPPHSAVFRLTSLSRTGRVWGFVRSRQRFVPPSQACGGSKAVGESGKDDYDKLSLPTGSGFPEDMLQAGARRLITDAEFDRSGPKCFSSNEMKC